jgi:hypothetical protein
MICWRSNLDWKSKFDRFRNRDGGYQDSEVEDAVARVKSGYRSFPDRLEEVRGMG